MTDELFKAVFHFPVPICTGIKMENPHTGEQQTPQQWVAWKKERDAREWLEQSGHEPPVMVYDNRNPLCTKGEIVVVLSDRSTAIMLKLALG